MEKTPEQKLTHQGLSILAKIIARDILKNGIKDPKKQEAEEKKPQKEK